MTGSHEHHMHYRLQPILARCIETCPRVHSQRTDVYINGHTMKHEAPSDRNAIFPVSHPQTQHTYQMWWLK